MIRGGSTDGPDEIGTWLCGCACVCLCDYEGTKEGPNDDKYGGSSTDANDKANGDNIVQSVKKAD